MQILLFFNLLLAHLVADFWLQPPKMLEDKKTKRCLGWGAYAHAAVIGTCSWIAVGERYFWPLAVLVCATHFLIDELRLRQKNRYFWPLICDQFAHACVLAFVAYEYGPHWKQFSFLEESWGLLLPVFSCGFVFLTIPANVLIREFFEFIKEAPPERVMFLCNEKGKDDTDDSFRIKRAGFVIGILERIMIFVLVYVGCYQAVGFLVTAKSILRYRDSTGAKAEYVLVGTLFSVSLAIVVAELLKRIPRIFFNS